MLLAWAMTTAAFIMIFVEIGRFANSKHAIVGTMVAPLAFIHPFLAFLRPSPDKKTHRAIFSFTHTIFGYGIIIGAFACIVSIQQNHSFAFFMHGGYSWLTTFFMGFYIIANLMLRKINADGFNATKSKIFLILFVFLCCCFTAAICTFIAIWPEGTRG